ncbi:MAG: N-(5'-phosphoribosyl)anthranilate isomerase [Rhodobacteraceae bacterium]|nr:N-(5'-phosphoribosyl)anthranilate isomerase [Paracoccaceae bacterium]
MQTLVRHNPERWIEQIFSAKAAQRGGVVRRSIGWVEREVGRSRFEAEVRKRGFHMIECGGQLVVICNGGGLRVIC